MEACRTDKALLPFNVVKLCTLPIAVVGRVPSRGAPISNFIGGALPDCATARAAQIAAAIAKKERNNFTFITSLPFRYPPSSSRLTALLKKPLPAEWFVAQTSSDLRPGPLSKKCLSLANSRRVLKLRTRLTYKCDEVPQN